MPSALALITGVTFDGVDLQDLTDGHLRIFFEIVAGGPDWAAEVRGEPRTMPYRAGQLASPRRPHRLPIMLEGFVAGAGADDAAQRADTAVARQEMRVLFQPWDGAKVLTATTEDGTDWTINAESQTGPIWDANPDPVRWGCSVRLQAIDPPYWTAVP